MADEPLFTPLSRDNATYEARKHLVEGEVVKDGRTEEEREADRKTKVLDLALRRFKVVLEAERIQRAQELEDLQFDRGRKEDHWPAEILKFRKGGTDATGTTTERPSLVINKFRVPIKQVINEGRASRLAIVVKPKPGKASAKDAEVRQGMLRAIEVDSNAQDARIWAYSRMVKCGRGYYRVEKQYANDGDFLIDLVVTRIKNQGAVYIDPFHTKPDGSDAEYYFLTEDLPKEEYALRFPQKKRIVEVSGDTLTSINDKAPGWVGADTVRIAEYFYVEHQQRWLVRSLADGKDVLLEPDEEPDDRLHDQQFRRAVDVRQVKWCLINAFEVIEEAEWDGRFIPIVQVIGEEFNVDGKSSYAGMITDGKDSQRLYNYAVSMEAEGVALAPRAPYVAAYGQIEPFKGVWEQANTRNFAVLPYKPVEVNGTLVPPPQRNVVEPAIQAIAMLVQQADQDIKAITGRYDPSLGNLSASERSGKAIREMKQQAEMGSSNYLDALATAIRHEATILLDLLPKVYVEPGRIARMIGDEPGDEQVVMLNAPFVRGKDGMPQPPPKPAMQTLQAIGSKIGMAQPPQEIEQYDLAKGDYMVVVDVGPSFKTQREENVALLQSLYEASPDMAPATMDIMAEELGGPFGRKLAERIRALNPNLPKGDNEDIPPQAQMLIQQMQQQMQEMQQALQQAQQALATDQAKQQAQVQIAQMEIDTKARIEQMKLLAEAGLQRAKLESDESRARFDAAMEKALQDDQQAHERYMATVKHQQAMTVAARGDASAERGDIRQAQIDAASAERAHERAEQSAERAAAREAYRNDTT